MRSGEDAEPVGHQFVQGVEAQVFALDVFDVAVKVVQAGAYHRAEAAVDVGLGVGFVVDVHVKARGDAAAEVFHYAELREDVHALVGQLRLIWPDLLAQPAVERHIVGEGAQEGHRGVRVRVLEAGDKKVALEVNLALKGGHVLICRPDMGYHAAVRPDLGV